MIQPVKYVARPISPQMPSVPMPEVPPYLPSPNPPVPSDQWSHISSLEPNSINTNNTVASDSIIVAPCRCRSWHCPKCQRRLGEDLLQRCVTAIANFRNILMLTLTLNRDLFPDAQSAYSYLKLKRCVGEVMRKLYRSKHPQMKMHSKKYLQVLEWQADGWPHFHLAVDASHIPSEELSRLWNSLAPPQDQPGSCSPLSLGYTWVSWEVCSSHCADGTARKLLKYITQPDHIVPQWVLDAPFRIRMYETSRGLFVNAAAPARLNKPRGLGAKQKAKRAPSKPLRERLAQCGTSCHLLQVSQCASEGSPKQKYTHLATLDVPPEVLYRAANGPTYPKTQEEREAQRITLRRLPEVLMRAADSIHMPLAVTRANWEWQDRLQSMNCVIHPKYAMNDAERAMKELRAMIAEANKRMSDSKAEAASELPALLPRTEVASKRQNMQPRGFMEFGAA